MADDLKRYWFIAAVFREPHDLVSTVRELRDNDFGSEVLVLANHGTGDVRKALDRAGSGQVPVVDAHSGGSGSVQLPVELGTLWQAMEAERRGDRSDGQSQVYAQLREDVAQGALVLVASVADPDQQLLGARILLRGNCECVLTHEIDASGA